MVADRVREVIFVGLPGPTHNYGGLSADNVASSTNRGRTSRPKDAALQAVEMVRLLVGLGVETAVLPPLLRPNLPLLATRFKGKADALITQAAKEAPELLEAASSASAMWAANAATVTPAVDAADGKLHITIANLHTNLHRRIEAVETQRLFEGIFAKVPDVVIHPPLYADKGFRDEGAANHMRLAPKHVAPGLEVFVYGTDGDLNDPIIARQNVLASKAICKHHSLPENNVLFLKQHPQAIEHGVFHNDVIAVSNEQVLLLHEKAYAKGAADIVHIEEAYESLNPGKMPVVLLIKDWQLSLEEAVRTYFFNSQLVTTGESMTLIAPAEVKTLYGGKGAALMEQLCADANNPIEAVHYIDLHQSMDNGGGPACLRLRVLMNEGQIAALKNSVNVVANEKLLDALEDIIETHYPETLTAQDLSNPALYHCSEALLTDLAALMKLKLL